MSENEKRKRVINLHEEKQRIIQQKKDVLREGEEIQGEFNEIKGYVEELVKLFNEAKFSSSVSTKMNYDSTTHFNEGNIVLYLSELEEYISYFI